MSLLKPAIVDSAYLKVGIYGATGSGKTFTALKIASEHGKKIAFVDTERGSTFYSNMFAFDRIHTRSLSEITQVMREVEQNHYDWLIIDSITHIWDELQTAYIDKYTKSQKDWAKKMRNTGNLPYFAWKEIKTPYKKFIEQMLNLNAHCIICGRLKNVFDKSDSDELVKIGETMKAENETPYEPSILIKMTCALGTDEHIAIIEKDRSSTIVGKTFINPGFEMLVPVQKALGTVHTVINDEDNQHKDAQVFQDDEEPLADSPPAKSAPAKADDDTKGKDPYYLLENFGKAKKAMGDEIYYTLLEKALRETAVDMMYNAIMKNLKEDGLLHANMIPVPVRKKVLVKMGELHKAQTPPPAPAEPAKAVDPLFAQKSSDAGMRLEAMLAEFEAPADKFKEYLRDELGATSINDLVTRLPQFIGLAQEWIKQSKKIQD